MLRRTTVFTLALALAGLSACQTTPANVSPTREPGAAGSQPLARNPHGGGPNRALVSVETLVGRYENHEHDGGGKTPEHFAEIVRVDRTTVRWSNESGASWTLFATEDPTQLRVGEDCPYRVQGYTHATVVRDGQGQVVMVVGPRSEAFRKKGSPAEMPTVTVAEANGGEPGPAVPSGAPAAVEVSCSFKEGWVAVLPADLYDPGEGFLMQALIGFTEDPSFWAGESDLAKYKPYAAQRCTRNSRRVERPAGEYMLLVGQANTFGQRNDYRDNGLIKKIVVDARRTKRFSIGVRDLVDTFVCISCPYLVVFRDGKAVEVGQVLKDRYSTRRYGTDVVKTVADVEGGVLRLRIDEREPETTYLDAVVVRVGGRTLAPLKGVVPAVRAADRSAAKLSMHESMELRFDAAHLPDGPVEVEIAVSGHYEPVGPML